MNDAVKSGLWSALWTFLGLFLTAALGFLAQLAQWASSSGHQPLPSISTLGYAVVAAAVAAITGLGVTVIRFAQSKNALPGTPPTFDAKSTVIR